MRQQDEALALSCGFKKLKQGITINTKKNAEYEAVTNKNCHH